CGLRCLARKGAASAIQSRLRTRQPLARVRDAEASFGEKRFPCAEGLFRKRWQATALQSGLRPQRLTLPDIQSSDGYEKKANRRRDVLRHSQDKPALQHPAKS